MRADAVASGFLYIQPTPHPNWEDRKPSGEVLHGGLQILCTAFNIVCPHFRGPREVSGGGGCPAVKYIPGSMNALLGSDLNLGILTPLIGMNSQTQLSSSMASELLFFFF